MFPTSAAGGGLDPATTPQELQALLISVAPCNVALHCPAQPEGGGGGGPTGHAFISFATAQEAAAAVQCLSRSRLHGRSLEAVQTLQAGDSLQGAEGYAVHLQAGGARLGSLTFRPLHRTCSAASYLLLAPTQHASTRRRPGTLQQSHGCAPNQPWCTGSAVTEPAQPQPPCLPAGPVASRRFSAATCGGLRLRPRAVRRGPDGTQGRRGGGCREGRTDGVSSLVDWTMGV